MVEKGVAAIKESLEELFDKMNEDTERRARPHLDAIERERRRTSLEFHRRGLWHIPIK